MNIEERRFVKSVRAADEKESRLGIWDFAQEVFDKRLKLFYKDLVKRYPIRVLKNALAWYESLSDLEAQEIPPEEIVTRYAGENSKDLTASELRAVIKGSKTQPKHPIDQDLPQREYDREKKEFKERALPLSAERKFKKLSSKEMRKVIEKQSRKLSGRA